MATYGAEFCTLNKYIAKRLDSLEKRSFKKKVWGIKVKENWRKRYNEELMQMFGDLDILSLVRIHRLYWSGHVNRMDGKSQVFKNNPQGSRLRG